MTGLGGSVHDGIGAKFLKAPENIGPVPDIKVMVTKIPANRFQTLLVPARIAVRPEEIGPHVIVNAMDLPTQFIEIRYHFRADKPARASYQHFHPNYLTPEFILRPTMLDKWLNAKESPGANVYVSSNPVN